ncbi:ZIP family metal transporter [Luteibaculum oceani]|uniref:ZIP family metal transporter n=1 Tax=Luteibaculum oceani TaxID=1294296 RepID=UPI0014776F2F|nr:ZIP family metal transporter [Luteibaculum oceani]
MPTAQIVVLLLVTVIPGIIILNGSLKSQGWIKPLLSLSGSFLLALSFCHLLPEAYHHEGATVGVFVLLGFFAQVILESVTKGVEHGHYHSHGHFSKYFPLLVIGGLSLHSMLEAMPIGGHNHVGSGNTYLTGIALHKFPIALTLASILKTTPLKNYSRWIWFGLFCLSAPIVIVALHFFPEQIISERFSNLSSAFAVGIFLHVSTTILFEVEDGHRLKASKFAAIISGLLIYYFLV